MRPGVGKENSVGTTMASVNKPGPAAGRRTLQVLHENSSKKGSAKPDAKPAAGIKAFAVFVDKPKRAAGQYSVEATKHSYVQTDLSGDQSALSPDLDFYKELAEKRRLALDDALQENQGLYVENDSLKAENDLLRQENESLRQTVAKAQGIVELLGPMLEEDSEENDSSSEAQDVDQEHQDADTVSTGNEEVGPQEQPQQ